MNDVKTNARISLSLYYALIFMSIGAYFSYISLYYADIRLSHVEIGLLTSIGALVALVGQPLWGIVSDRSPFKNTVLKVCLLFSVAGIWLIPLSGNLLWPLILATVVFTFFQCAINPLSDAIALEIAAKQQLRFSTIRTMGSVGFAVMSLLAGWLFASDIRYIFSITSLLLFFAFLLSYSIPPVAGHQSGQRKVRFIDLFRNKRLVYIYIYAFLIECTLGFFFAFHAVYSGQLGIGPEWVGLGLMIGSFSQFPFMMFFEKFYKRFGIIRLLIASGIIHAVRWLLYATVLSSGTILWIWLLHGGTYIIFYLCLAQYVQDHVMDELKASGQMMNAVIVSGISKIAGGLAGGWYASVSGFQSAFYVSALLSAAAAGGFAAVVKYSPVFRERRETAAPVKSMKV